MEFHMCTYPCNISKFIQYSICRMGKKIIYLLPLCFFLPPQAKQLEITVFTILGSMEMDHSLIKTQIRVASTTEKQEKILLYLYTLQRPKCVCDCVSHFCWSRQKPQTTEWPKYLLKYLALGNIGHNFLQCNIISFPGSVTSAESKHQPRPGICELALHHTSLATASWGFQLPRCPGKLQREVTTTRNLWQIEKVPDDKCIRFWVYCLRC